MLKITKSLACLFALLVFNNSYSQLGDSQKPSWTQTLEYKFVPSITDKIKDGTFIKLFLEKDYQKVMTHYFIYKKMSLLKVVEILY
jgi:hypothetical protein